MDQYLQFCSNQPLQHKLGIIRMLAHRCATVCKNRESRTQETQHLKKVLSVSGYTKTVWEVATVSRPRTRSSDAVSSGSTSKGSVIIPYVGQVSDQIARFFRSSGMITHIRPYNTIRASLVRPKDSHGSLWKNRQVWCTPSNVPTVLHLTLGRPRDPWRNGSRNTDVPSPQCVNT